ncbi:MAG: enoyl-CoA hydratase, partial [Sphingomonas sp.]
MDELILRDEREGVVTLTLNNPARRNPISDPATIDAFCDAITAADRDIAVRVVILTGAGKAFSTGGDIAAMREGGGLNASLPADTRRNYRHGIQRLPLLFESIEVPVIAAVNGAAIGAG